MTPDDMLSRQDESRPNEGLVNRYWPHEGGTLEQLALSRPAEEPLMPPAPGELVCRVEAVSICSSDIKVIRMGSDHPLFSRKRGPTVLGHEVCLRIHAVGRDLGQRFGVGQRMGLQPAIVGHGPRQIVGMDLPGGFAQFLRLSGPALNELFPVPDTLSAAEIALLEPYGCVERAWQPNVRRALTEGGRALVVCGRGWNRITASAPPHWAEATCLGGHPVWLRADRVATIPALPPQGSFDDIVALGEIDAAQLGTLVDRLTPGGMLVQARRQPCGPVPLDPARVHYDRLAFAGTSEDDLCAAFLSAAQRFDVRPGGAALVLGAGGAMGRIHVHRLLQMADGPAHVVATSRKGRRLDDLRQDFTPLAERSGRRFSVVEDQALEQSVPAGGFDDAAVIAPLPEAVERAARVLAPSGLLNVFAGMAYGSRVAFDLSRVATDGARLTGSTGCTVGEMQGVLARVRAGELSLLANVAATAGLDSLPGAMKSVLDGAVSGKIVLYPQAPALPLRPVEQGWSAQEEAVLL